MNNLYDTLELCLQELENGADLDSVLTRYPKLASELRPILETSVHARRLTAAEPSAQSIRRGRSKVLRHAGEMLKAQAKTSRRMIPAFQRLAISFALAVTFLLSGTGLLNASASALPGERLYPVKRSWEDVRLLLIFNEQARNIQKYKFEDERLHEVNELLTAGRNEDIQFAGLLMIVNGRTYVSGIEVIIPANLMPAENGKAVLLSGKTNSDGYVEVSALEPLPTDSVVPAGSPVVVEPESTSESSPINYAMSGTLNAISTNTLVINQLTVFLDRPRIVGQLCPGIYVEAQGYFASNGNFMVTEVAAKGSCAADNNNELNDNSNTNTNVNDGKSGNDNENGDNGGNDNGSDGGGNGGNDNGGDGGGGKGGNDNGGDGGGGKGGNDNGSDGNGNDGTSGKGGNDNGGH